MARFTLTREFYVVPGSVKVADRKSDAVAYVYTSAKGNFGYMVFFRQAS